MGHPAKQLEPWHRFDLVCGMQVEPENSRRYIHKHREYYFCSKKCLYKFRTHPERYLKTVQYTDQVCGMDVSEQSEHRVRYDGIDYHFCSANCEKKFAVDPKCYLRDHAEGSEMEAETGHSDCGHSNHVTAEGKTQGVAPASGSLYFCPMCPGVEQDQPGTCPKCGMALEAAGEPATVTRTEYTCPMHPEIVQDHPGTCPKCGMALEPRAVDVEEQNEELIDMSRRFWVSAVLALPVFMLAMVADLVPDWLPDGISMKTVQWIEFLLATPVVLWGGWPFFVRGWQSVVSWNLNMFTLIGLGVAVAWSYSVVALLFPTIFPPNMGSWGFSLLKRHNLP
ncbi:MAG: heavy metal-binding domain-containing protein [Candidatus Thiodiazotropha sp. (ex. Lucinoma kazani)]